MNDEALPYPMPPSPEALFRRFVLGQVEALVQSGCKVGRAVRTVAQRAHVSYDGRTGRRLSASTIKRWRAAFLAHGVQGLEPKPRPRTEDSEVLPAELVAFVKSEKRRDKGVSVPELIRRAVEHGIIPAISVVHRATVWRTVQRLGLPTRHKPSKHEADTRRWAYPHRMQCVLCDGKHFRAGATRAKRVALFFLDNATRYGLDVLVATAESTEVFLNGLYHLGLCFGLADRFYLDHGPGFISLDTHAVITALDAWLILGKTAYPEGHGAVERFNQTAQNQVLRSLDGAADVDPNCENLTLRLRHYLRRYNDTPHEALNGQTPQQRWLADPRPLTMPESQQVFRDKFVVREARSVSKDHVIKHDGKLWEAPRGLARAQIEVIRHVLDGHLYVQHHGHLVRLHQVDLAANATDRRGYPGDDLPQPDEGVPTTAATLAFNRDYAPITAPDGGFSTDKED
jgi:transposase InsO family protein